MSLSSILLDSLSVSFVWFLSCIFFHMCWILLSAKVIPGFQKNLRIEEQKAWFNRGVSTIHASVMFTITIYYWLFVNPNFQISDAGNIIETYALDIMMGYLYYDILYELLTSQQTDALSHHILGLVSHLSTRLSNNTAAAYYSMLVYIAEGSTPFLNISWLLHQLQLKNTRIFSIFTSCLVISFFICRILLGPYMVQHMMRHREQWGEEGRYFLFLGNTMIVSIFSILNFIWFYKLVNMALPKKIKNKNAPYLNSAEKIL